MKLFGRKNDDEASADEAAGVPSPDARVEDLPPPDAEAVQPDVPTPEEADEIAADAPSEVAEPEPVATPEPVQAPEPVAITTGPAASGAPGAGVPRTDFSAPDGNGGSGSPSLPAPVADVAQKRPEALVAGAFVGAFLVARVLKRITSK